MRPIVRARMDSHERARRTREVKLSQMVLRRVEKVFADENESIEVRIVKVCRMATLYPDMHFCMADASADVTINYEKANSFNVILTYADRKGFIPFGALADSLASEILDKIGELLDESEE
ncbi:MAG TPA: hypothetical protein PK547_02350 [Candidatus Paceibacterota bacterium]|nr:hypothetical protein [Candidatus Paceibacterota bacterium]